MDIRLIGTTEENTQLVDLLKALEHLQQTGEVLPTLRTVRLEILDEGENRDSRRSTSRLKLRYMRVNVIEGKDAN